MKASLAIAGLLAAGASLAEERARPVALTSLGQFQQAFNRDAGRPRLVLLLSPT